MHHAHSDWVNLEIKYDQYIFLMFGLLKNIIFWWKVYEIFVLYSLERVLLVLKAVFILYTFDI